MKTTFAIETSRELSSFSFYKDALYAFESVLSKGLLRFNSDLVGEICIGLICLSPMFGQFFQARRPKYYEDKTLKFRGSVTPEVRMYKCLTVDFVVDFEGYFRQIFSPFIHRLFKDLKISEQIEEIRKRETASGCKRHLYRELHHIRK